MKLTKYTEVIPLDDGTVIGRVYSRKSGFIAEKTGEAKDVTSWLAQQMKDAMPADKAVH